MDAGWQTKKTSRHCLSTNETLKAKAINLEVLEQATLGFAPQPLTFRGWGRSRSLSSPPPPQWSALAKNPKQFISDLGVHFQTNMHKIDLHYNLISHLICWAKPV